MPTSPRDIPNAKPPSSSSSPKSNSLYGDSPTNFTSPRLSRRSIDMDNFHFVPPKLQKGVNNVFASSPPRKPFSYNEVSTTFGDKTDFTINQGHDPRSLLKAVRPLIKSRSGTVLTRNTILKMDHFSSGTNTKLEFHLEGAPNFRSTPLNTYGSAQPTVIGLSTILSILNCHPKQSSKTSCTWFSTREEPLVYLNGCPYVLREYANPMQNMNLFLGIKSTRLEKVEQRLKSDVIKEANTMGGLLLVHQELSDGTIVPCYLAADKVQTPSEVFQEFIQQGYRVKYFRIPISPDQAPEDNYFDEYIRVIRTLEPTDPLIFNCGIGNVRTTVGIIIAQIIRRTQLIERGYPDPFIIPGYEYQSNNNSKSDGFMSMEMNNSRTKLQETLLKLVYVLEQALDSKMSTQSAIEWVIERGNNMDNLMDAIKGNYQSVTALTSVLESGIFSKCILDEMIDQSDAIVNLREIILINRIKYNNTRSSGSDIGGGYDNNKYLEKASNALQRYYFLLCFSAYVNESPDTQFETRFSSWIKARSELWSMLQNMRRKGPKLYYFRPIEELQPIQMNSIGSRLSSLSHTRYHDGGGMFNMIGAGSQQGEGVVGEIESMIIQSRKGAVFTAQTILKVDFWYYHYLDSERQQHTVIHSKSPRWQIDNRNQQTHHAFYIEGASNFRRIDNTHIYATAQPTVVGLRQVIRQLLTDKPHNERILWINLREEPIIYINGIPYVLRDRYYTLRNIRAYKGITGARLEQLEERLKEDIIEEINNCDGRLLLHGENHDGQVFAQWEEVTIDSVLTAHEVMESVAWEVAQDLELPNDLQSILNYHRIPITAEKIPSCEDFDELRSVIAGVDLGKTAIVMNCQIGFARSTTGTVIATLLTRWLQNQTSSIILNKQPPTRRRDYQIINSLLRVIKHGLENKRIVDDTLDQCGLIMNLRDVIEEARVHAEQEMDPVKRKQQIKRGGVALERYYMLICFQVYLDSTSPDLMHETESFGHYMKRHAELFTILKELQTNDNVMEFIVPVEQDVSLSNSIYDNASLTNQGDGVALTSEVLRVVNNRHGQVLAQQTILKHDAFPGCQKMSLREKITGAYNFRRIPINQMKQAMIKDIAAKGSTSSISGLAIDMDILQYTMNSNRDTHPNPELEILLQQQQPPFICGSAMPNDIRSLLASVGAGPGGKRKVLWTCLREEPVLYINKRPYVLRLQNNPLRNLETTGIAKERVEHMERIMLKDTLEELKMYNGRLLLHDEETAEKGGFLLVPTWETVSVENVQTPDQAFQSIIDEGYQVDYLRIPITDEQAPIPDVFDQLIDRFKVVDDNTDMFFNCQMGRGRTTTGMVTAFLMTMILKNDDILDMTRSYMVESVNIGSNEPITNSFDEENNDERQRLLNGEYLSILQLLSVLSYGKLAKKLTDQAVDMCDHMQNLRKAIYDLKLRMDAAEPGSSKWQIASEGASNYLVRYFYLIVFANYLLESVDQENKTPSIEYDSYHVVPKTSNVSSATDTKNNDKITSTQGSFKTYLKNHREITNILKYQPKELS
ncbi:unnamed protein product [Cunninghamella echinulata]